MSHPEIRLINSPKFTLRTGQSANLREHFFVYEFQVANNCPYPGFRECSIIYVSVVLPVTEVKPVQQQQPAAVAVARIPENRPKPTTKTPKTWSVHRNPAFISQIFNAVVLNQRNLSVFYLQSRTKKQRNTSSMLTFRLNVGNERKKKPSVQINLRCIFSVKKKGKYASKSLAVKTQPSKVR